MLGLTASVILMQIMWISADRRPAEADAGLFHLPNVLVVAGRADAVVNTLDYYPPLVYWNAVPYLAAWGDRGPLLSLQLFVLIMGVSTWWMGRRAGGSDCGLLACFFVLTLPQLAAFSRTFFLDYPLAAVTMLASCMIYAAGNDELDAIWVGPILAVGMMVKWAFFAFIAWPVVWLVARAIRTRREGVALLITAINTGVFFAVAQTTRASSDRSAVFDVEILCVISLAALRFLGKQYASRLAMGMIIGIGLVAPWYVPHLAGLERAATHVFGGPVSDLHCLLEAMVYLPGLPLFLTASMSVVWAAVHWRTETNATLHLAMQVGVSVLLLDRVPYKEARYLLPVVPMIAVMASLWLTASSRSGSVRYALAAAFVGLGLTSTMAWRVVPDISQASWLYGTVYAWKQTGGVIGCVPEVRIPETSKYALPLLGMLPDDEAWPVEAVARLLPSRSPLTVTYLTEEAGIDFPYELRYAMAQRNVELSVQIDPRVWHSSDLVMVVATAQRPEGQVCQRFGMPWPVPLRRIATLPLHHDARLSVFAGHSER